MLWSTKAIHMFFSPIIWLRLMGNEEHQVLSYVEAFKVES